MGFEDAGGGKTCVPEGLGWGELLARDLVWLTVLLAHSRECQTEAGGHREQFHHVLHGGAPRAAGQQPSTPEAAACPEPQPFHGHRSHPHGDGGGHLPETGAPAVPGDAEWVSGRTGVDGMCTVARLWRTR